MQLSEILTALGTTHHSGRITWMIQWARSAPHDERRELLGRMFGKGPYLRQMALYAAQAVGEVELLLPLALSEPCASLRRLCLRAVARLGSDPQVRELLQGLNLRARRFLLQQLQRQRRQELVDTWLHEQSTPSLDLVVFGGEAVLDRHAESLRERGHLDHWTRLARCRPGWASANALGSFADRQAERAAWVLRSLADRRQPQLIDLWTRTLEAGVEPRQLPEEQMFLAFPVAALGAIQRDQHPGWPLERRAHRFSLELCQRLLECGWLELQWNWWKQRSRDERVVLWQQHYPRLIGSHGQIQPCWLELLPLAERTEMARSQSALSWTQFDVQVLSQWHSLLPYEEGLEALQEAIRSPVVEDRAAGLAGWVRLGRYFPERRAEILQALNQRANEADPVRAAFLQALASLPPARWGPEHFRGLGEVLKALISAADGSPQSYAAAETLVLGLLAHQPSWSCAWMGKLLRHWGRVSLTSWEVHLQKPGLAAQLQDELLPLFVDWRARERFDACFALCRALGRHLKQLPQLVEEVAAICSHPEPEPARRALIWLHEAGQLAARVPPLLAQDPSWIEQSLVRDYLHRRRQDLLDGYLDGRVMAGKFASGQTEWVVGFHGRFWSWTPDQQARYAEKLATLVSDPQRDFPAVRQGLRLLSRLPAIPPVALQARAQLDESRQAVRDEALRSLARVEGGSGLATLFEALEDERARIAVYALRSALLQMPPGLALQKLQAIESPKITVQKEVVRLCGDLEDGLGLPLVLQRLEQQPLHRDVHLAGLRALWSHLDREECWPSLEQAARLEDPAFGQALSAIPERGLGAPARQRLGNLMVDLLDHPRPRVRLAVLSRMASLPPSDPDGRLARQALARLPEPHEGGPAASVLLSLAGGQPELWAGWVRETLPLRQSLVQMLRALQYRLNQHSRFQALLAPTQAVLQEDPATLMLRLRLIAARGVLDDLLASVEDEVLSDPSAWDVPLNWPELLRLYRYRLSSRDFQVILERWGPSQVDPRLRRLCLQALLAHTQAFGWTTESRGWLADFRQDNSALVRSLAEFTFPPD